MVKKKKIKQTERLQGISSFTMSNFDPFCMINKANKYFPASRKFKSKREKTVGNRWKFCNIQLSQEVVVCCG